MSILLGLMSTTEFRSAVLCSYDGFLQEAIGDDLDAEQLSATMGFIHHQISCMGTAISLGSVEKIIVPHKNLLIVNHGGAIIALYLQSEAALLQAEKYFDQTSDSSSLSSEDTADAFSEEKSNNIDPGRFPTNNSSAGGSLASGTGGNLASKLSASTTSSAPSAQNAPHGQNQLNFQAFVDLQRSIRSMIDKGSDLTPLFKKNGARLHKWVVTADFRIVELLADNAISEAEELLQLLNPLLVVKDQQAGNDAKESTIYKEAIDSILCGLRTYQIGDLISAITCFRAVLDKPNVRPSHRWLATYWLIRSSIACGDLETAQELTESLATTSSELSSITSFHTHLLLGNLELIAGNAQNALQYAEQAQSLAATDEQLAYVLMLTAKGKGEIGQSTEGIRLAERAHELFPTWADPCDFLVQQAISENKLWRASALLSSSTDQDTVQERSTQRTRYVVTSIQNGIISNDGARQYLFLKDAVALDSTIEQLQELVASFPEFVVARETLAWKLLNRGHGKQASAILTELSRNVLPSFLEASVSLGLSCVAIAHDEHPRQEGRIHAMNRKGGKDDPASSFPDAPTPLGVFAGELRHFPLPDLLEFFNIRRRTGTVVINTTKGSGAISLRNGRIVAATSPNTDNLGKMLLKKQKLTSEQLTNVLEIQRKESSRLMGEILVQLEYLDENTLRSILTQQILHSVRELIENPDGDFAFEPSEGTAASSTDLDLSLDSQFVLLEIFRTIDEESR